VLPGTVVAEQEPFSSRPKRTVVERSAVCFALIGVPGHNDSTLCHLDRSEA
jgi:hypothetical protein